MQLNPSTADVGRTRTELVAELVAQLTPSLSEMSLRAQQRLQGLSPQDVAARRTLAAEQKPHSLLLCCADSRLDPAEIFAAAPGELFVVRNAGNILASSGRDGTAASIEYAVQVLGVRRVLICGHTGCGAMAALGAAEQLAALPACAAHLQGAAQLLERCGPDASCDERVAANVLLQAEHLAAYPWAEHLWRRGELQVYGFVFGLEQLRLQVYEPQQQRFCDFAQVAGLEQQLALPLPQGPGSSPWL